MILLRFLQDFDHLRLIFLLNFLIKKLVWKPGVLRSGGRGQRGPCPQIFRTFSEIFGPLQMVKINVLNCIRKSLNLSPLLYRCYNSSNGNPLANSIGTKGARNMSPSLLPKINFLICPNLMRNIRVGERGFYRDT